MTDVWVAHTWYMGCEQPSCVIAGIVAEQPSCSIYPYVSSTPYISFLQAWALQQGGSSPRSSSAAPSVWRCLWNPSPRHAATASAKPACRATGTTARSLSVPCARRPTPKNPRWASTGSWLKSPPSSRVWWWLGELRGPGLPRGDPRWTWTQTLEMQVPQAATLGSLPRLGRCRVMPALGGS